MNGSQGQVDWFLDTALKYNITVLLSIDELKGATDEYH